MRMSTEADRAAKRRYNHSDKGRASRRRYAQTDKGRIAQRKAKRRWNADNADVVRVASYERKAEQKARIDVIKVTTGCTDCGYSAHPAALEFDHVIGDKVANVSRLIGSTWSRLEAEMEKCEVVCANCHRIRTVTRWESQ